MRDQLPHRHVLLPVLRELRPPLRDLAVVVDRAARLLDREREGGDALRRGKDGRQRPLLPRRLRAAVAVAAPEVDDLDPSVEDGDRGAELAARAEVLHELLPHALPALCDGAVDQLRLPVLLRAHLERALPLVPPPARVGRPDDVGVHCVGSVHGECVVRGHVASRAGKEAGERDGRPPRRQRAAEETPLEHADKQRLHVGVCERLQVGVDGGGKERDPDVE